MTRRSVTLRTVATCGALALVAILGACDRGGDATPPPVDAETRAAAAEICERWRESLLLDLASEVIDEGLARTSPGGDLAEVGEARALVARALFASGDEAAAAEHLAASEGDGDPFVALERARQALEQDELARALELTEGPLPGGPESPGGKAHLVEVWRVRGLALARLGRDAEAREELLRFVDAWPTDVDAAGAHAVLERIARAAGDDEAVARHRTAAAELGNYWAYRIARLRQLRADPDALLPALGLARQRLAVGDVIGARADLQRLVARHPDACEAWATLGDAERRRGAAEAARAAWTRALECAPGLAGARYNRAQLAILERRYADAALDLERLVESGAADESPFVHAHVELARLLRAAGRADEAALRYARYRELGGAEELVPR